MKEFNVGERVVVVGNEAMFGLSKEERNGVGVITDLPDREGCYGVTLDTGYYVAAKPENIHYYVEVTLKSTPPKKIIQNGYEYELVGPVKPDWLVDGAWVVSRITGKLYKTIQVGNDQFQALKGDGFNNSGNLTAEEFSSAYRPHEPKDYKWGDWAMYDGKKVFVVGGVDNTGRVLVSYPDIYPLGRNDADRNFLLIPSAKLTPTF